MHAFISHGRFLPLSHVAWPSHWPCWQLCNLFCPLLSNSGHRGRDCCLFAVSQGRCDELTAGVEAAALAAPALTPSIYYRFAACLCAVACQCLRSAVPKG